jgi:hypothetical protein
MKKNRWVLYFLFFLFGGLVGCAHTYILNHATILCVDSQLISLSHFYVVPFGIVSVFFIALVVLLLTNNDRPILDLLVALLGFFILCAGCSVFSV